MLALILPTGAFAAEGTLSPYSNTPSTTTSTPTPSTSTPTPSTGTSPEKTEKESSTPTKTTAPETTSTTPTTEPTAKKASTLPFTGFDLRWTIAGGVLLMAMGFSIVTAQRRRGSRR